MPKSSYIYCCYCRKVLTITAAIAEKFLQFLLLLPKSSYIYSCYCRKVLTFTAAIAEKFLHLQLLLPKSSYNYCCYCRKVLTITAAIAEKFLYLLLLLPKSSYIYSCYCRKEGFLQLQHCSCSRNVGSSHLEQLLYYKNFQYKKKTKKPSNNKNFNFQYQLPRSVRHLMQRPTARNVRYLLTYSIQNISLLTTNETIIYKRFNKIYKIEINERPTELKAKKVA